MDINQKLTCFIGYVKAVNCTAGCKVEHLEHVEKESSMFWRYLYKTDEQDIENDQIMNCKIEGEFVK